MDLYLGCHAFAYWGPNSQSTNTAGKCNFWKGTINIFPALLFFSNCNHHKTFYAQFFWYVYHFQTYKTRFHNHNMYNAITQNNCFVKGSHKYDVYLAEKNKGHVNWPYKNCNLLWFNATSFSVLMTSVKILLLTSYLMPLLNKVT